MSNNEEGQTYALKFLPSRSDDSRAQLESEIKSVLNLDNENVIKFLDFGECEINSVSGLFLISEYCADGNYRSMLSNSIDDISIEKTLIEIKQILNGLSSLHNRTIHRDLKPENILISSGILKLTDFGISKFLNEATRTLTFKGSGTPRYMAPEIWENKHATPATDLYSLGIILFEALTGKPPFESDDVYELRRMHLYTPSPRA